MAETDFKQLRARAVFSDAARVRLETTDEPIQAHDSVTGIDLHYRFETHAGGVLRLTGGPIGEGTLAVGCEPESLNLIATILLDGLKVQIR
ncbi:MAG TPA: hypothetical protein PK264_19325 [Hyphomicrobiaceae bacterium]|nr:hypothetical protein [Hyphomicrobiaceae bacterium]